MMKGQTASFKCEDCNVSLYLATQFDCHRLYHTMNCLVHVPRESRNYVQSSVKPTPENDNPTDTLEHENSSLEFQSSSPNSHDNSKSGSLNAS